MDLKKKSTKIRWQKAKANILLEIINQTVKISSETLRLNQKENLNVSCWYKTPLKQKDRTEILKDGQGYVRHTRTQESKIFKNDLRQNNVRGKLIKQERFFSGW